MNVSNPNHRHHAVWREYVQSVLDGQPKSVEYKLPGEDDWRKSDDDTNTDGFTKLPWFDEWQYRIAPPTVTRTITHPAPMTVASEIGSEYWTVDTAHASAFLKFTWRGDDFDVRQLQRGLCWATEAEASEAAKAFFGGVV